MICVDDLIEFEKYMQMFSCKIHSVQTDHVVYTVDFRMNISQISLYGVFLLLQLVGSRSCCGYNWYVDLVDDEHV